MNRLEIAAKLFENPKLKARNNMGHIVHVGAEDGYKAIRCIDTEYGYNDILQLVVIHNETWEIIEPVRKLKEFCFGEMNYMVHKNTISSKLIKSIVSGLDYYRTTADITLEELKGKWTIDGYYEEDDNE